MDDPARRPGEGQRGPAPPPRFVTGPLLRHVLVMSGTGAVGLMALFLADLVNVVYLGMMRDADILAAVGYAGPELELEGITADSVLDGILATVPVPR